MVSDEDFLRNIFGVHYGSSWVVAVRGDPGGSDASGWGNGGPASAYLARCKQDTNNFFCVSTIRGNQRRTIANCELVIALVLDDLGTKGDLDRALDLLGFPTWLIETSPGNFQAGYAYDKPLGKSEFGLHAALVQAAHKRGLADNLPDPTRLVRLPSGKNLKAKYQRKVDGEFPSVELKMWNPSKRFSPLDLALLLDVDGSDVQTLGQRIDTSDLKPSADLNNPDQWLQALSILGMVRGEGSSLGKVEIVCPWESDHTIRADTGTAYLGKGRFKCQHGHCAGKSSPEFHEAILGLLEEEAGGLATGRGVMCEIVFGGSHDLDKEDQVVLSRLEAVFKGAGAGGVGAAGGAGKPPPEPPVETWDEAVERLVYVLDLDSFASVKSGNLLTRRQVDVVLSRVVPVGKTGTNAGHNQLLMDRRLQRVDTLTFRPGQGMILTETHDDGRVVSALNTWRPSGVVSKDPSQWGVHLDTILKHMEMIIPDQEVREVVTNWMAHNVQKPGVKIPWAILIQGAQGVGKDFLLKAFKQVVGHHNCRDVTTPELVSEFNPWLRTQIVVMQELSGTDRHDLNNKLKPWIAAPPMWVTVNQKFQPPVQIPNIQNWIGLTNKEGAVAIDHDDRRFFVYRSPAVKQPAGSGYYARLAEAVVEGAGEFKGYLERVDLSRFDPNVCPETTQSKLDKQDMARLAGSSTVQAIRAIVEESHFGDRVLISSVELSRAMKAEGVARNDRAVSEAMKEMGFRHWKDGLRVRINAAGERARVWVRERHALYDQMTADQIKDAWGRERGELAA